MKIAKEKTKYIYCLEGDWEKDLRKKVSIVSTLVYLNDCFNIKYVYKNCPTIDSFNHYLKEYHKKRYDKHTILYLACHGKQNEIILGKDTITLDKFEENNKGLLKNKIIHFGTCSSLDLKKERLVRFVENTGALCVSGYQSDIEFNNSTILDVLYFKKWQDFKDVRCVERDMKKEYKEFVKSLKFIMVYN